VILDFDDSKIGFIGYTVDKRLIPLPIEGFPSWAVIAIIIGAVLMTALGILLYCRHKKK
jgi:hypothetical protein